ncbi:hypothetical protein AB0C51_17935 [Streptomyces pathocidini]|uniref:hypothetical protein n=1 Tax=Streptomyces pathocidini TaxID=1650571 RepID=UPI0033E9BAE0
MVLAMGVSVALCVSLIVVSLSKQPVSQQFAGVLSALSGATVGALATYLGGAAGEGRRRRGDEVAEGRRGGEGAEQRGG